METRAPVIKLGWKCIYFLIFIFLTGSILQMSRMRSSFEPVLKTFLPFDDIDKDFERIKSLQPSPTDPWVLNYLRRFHLIPPSIVGYHPTKKVDHESEFLDDLRKIFNASNRGFFVECGANDGEFLSNTLDLETRLNWTGLLIEADPEFRGSLQTKNRSAWVANVCLSPSNNISELEFLISEKSRKVPWHSQGQGHLWNGKRNRDVPYPKKIVKVKCFPLISLLGALNVTRVDYLSLDMQGWELQILRTLPFNSQLIIEYIQVEYELVPNGKIAVKRFLKSKGYDLILHKGFDYLFRKRPFQSQSTEI